MLPSDQVAYFVCLLLSFPLSLLYWKYLLPRKGVRLKKELYFAAFGHLFLLILFLPNYHHSAQNKEHPLRWLMHVYIPTLFTYGWCWLMRGKRWMPYLNFAFLLSFTTFLHWCRYKWQYGEYRLDHITVIMLLVIKLSSFAFDINDAYRERPPAHGKKPAVKAAEEEKIDPRLEHLKDNYYPSLLEFLAYNFLYAGVLTGPAVFYPEFKSFLDGTFFNFPSSGSKKEDLQHAATVLDHATLVARKKRVRSLLFKSAIFIGLHLLLGEIVPPPSYFLSEKFAASPWYLRIIVTHFVNFRWRTKYYLAWMLAECSHVVLGLGYQCTLHTNAETNMTTVHYSWDRLEMVDPVKVETSNNFRLNLMEWHKTANTWLYRYVYLRCSFLNNAKRGKPGFRANLLTKLVSALWHGLYPGYYAMFITAALYTWLTQLAYRNLCYPQFVPARLSYWITLIVNYALTDYVIAAFELWPIQDSLTFYKATKFFGHIVIIGGILLIKLVIQPMRVKQHQQ